MHPWKEFMSLQNCTEFTSHEILHAIYSSDESTICKHFLHEKKKAMCSIPLYIPPASLASRGRDPHLNTQNDNYANARMYGRIYSMYYFLCIIIVLSGFLLHMQASIRTQLLTSIFSEQQQMALQHWSSVSFMMEELWGGKATGKQNEWFPTICQMKLKICCFLFKAMNKIDEKAWL